ncbi:MAG: hypothetical protein L6R36_005426 [Xanthoria steineri]|nr:MAG: hypothetical protein L6R36_005426 [Xanthoria steineri]
MPTKPARPPPYKHDISHKFQLADSHNLGGHGCFNAGVFIVKRISTGENAVQKRYKTEDIRNGTAEFEMRIMRKYSHDNIVEYLCGFIDETTHQEPVASVFMEYCDEGNVNDVLKEHFKLDQPMDENKVWHIATGLVNAVAFLQYGVRDACFNPEPPKPNWTGVLHRDIKPDNIFLCSQPGEPLPRVVLGDFGQGYLVNDDGKWGRQYMFGNTSTAPPEVNAGGLCAYTFAGDVYAVGATMRIIWGRITDLVLLIGTLTNANISAIGVAGRQYVH